MSRKEIIYNKFGKVDDILEFVTTDSKKLNNDEVRIKVYSVGLNPVDYKIFEGVKQLRILSFFMKLKRPSEWFKSKKALFPRGVGRDFSGGILEIGSNVSNFSVGDKVFGTIINPPGLGTKKGALTTELCVKESEIYIKPDNISFNMASTMGVASLTVGGAFRKINLQSDDIVVISAASGGIGSIAVQYAVAKGAKVLGIASENSSEYIKSLGGIPISYNRDIESQIYECLNEKEKVTKFLDCYGGEYVKLGFNLGLKGSDIGTLVPSPYVMIRGANFTGPRHSRYSDFIELAKLVSNNQVKINVDNVYNFSLADVKKAYNKLEQGHTKGKLVVEINKE